MMRVHGNQAVYSGGARGLFPPAGRSSGSGFMERLKNAADAAASEQAADTLRLTKTDDRLLNLYHSQGPGADGLWTCLDEGAWKGDPLAYLDNWMKSLYSWRSDLARARNEDGSPKYGDFSPITDQLNSCQKVMDLVRGLSQTKI